MPLPSSCCWRSSYKKSRQRPARAAGGAPHRGLGYTARREYITTAPARGLAMQETRTVSGRSWVLPALISLVAVLALVVPVAWSLGGAIALAVERYKEIIGLAFVVFLVLLLFGAARMVFAFGRRLSAQARQAEIVRLQNDQPIHLLDVSPLARAWAPEMLARSYEVQLAEAQREHPNLTTYHYTNHQQGLALPSAAAAEPAAGMAAELAWEQGKPRLQQMRERGHVCRSGKSLLVGYSVGEPVYIELPECGFIGVAGQPRVGKSTAVRLLLAQAAISGWHIAIGDPHIHKEDGLINSTRHISGSAIRLAVTPDEVAEMVRYVDRIGRARVNGDQDRTPVLMVIDEFTNFVLRGLLPDDVLSALPAMAMEYAGVGVHGIIIGHDWTRSLLGGDLGAALRRAVTHRIVCRCDAGNAEFLLPNAALSRQAAGLQKGQALYWGTDAPAIVAVPWLAEEDMAYAGLGQPQRLYQPRARSAAGGAAPQLAPTIRASQLPVAEPPRAAPPTQPISLTVSDQVVMLLQARQEWLTASEIASLLKMDVKVIRTEITPLVDQKKIDRRSAGKGRKEKYEYSGQSINQPVAEPSAAA